MTPCECTLHGLEPFWRVHDTGPVYCLRCGNRHVTEAPPGWTPTPPDLPDIPPRPVKPSLDHPVAAAAILAAALTPDLPEPPP